MSSNGEARGLKRQADDALDDEQRFAKRFNLLNLDRNGKLYIPVPTQPASQQPTLTPSRPRTAQNNNTNDSYMQLDDTKHKVYIYNLDEELADIDSTSSETKDDEKVIFLPDIEKKLSKIPKHLLASSDGSKTQVQHGGGHQELVLYSVPSSLTLPKEQDSVRKAIVEARQRAREVALKGAAATVVAAERGGIHTGGVPETAHGYGAEEYAEEEIEDPDAMDIG